MFGTLLQWLINVWVGTTGRVVHFKDAPWLEGPMGDASVIGDKFYERYAASRGLVVDAQHQQGLIGDFSSLIADDEPLKPRLHPRVKHFYEHTIQYKLEVWSEWYSPIKFFSRILIKSVSSKMNQLNIPLNPLETSHGMSNEVLQLKDPATNQLVCACWLRKSIKSGRVVYAGFYSGCIANGRPYVKVAFPLPDGNVTVLLRVEVQQDGSVKLVSHGKRIGDAGYYRIKKRDAGSVRVKYVPLQESIHVYEDTDGTLRTDHLFAFLGIKFLHLHYKIIPAA
jgi:hypothetical protein